MLIKMNGSYWNDWVWKVKLPWLLNESIIWKNKITILEMQGRNFRTIIFSRKDKSDGFSKESTSIEVYLWLRLPWMTSNLWLNRNMRSNTEKRQHNYHLFEFWVYQGSDAIIKLDDFQSKPALNCYAFGWDNGRRNQIHFYVKKELEEYWN